MPSINDSTMPFALPKLPAPYRDFIKYLNENPNLPAEDVVAPYNEYEGKLRECFAQYPKHCAIQDPEINAVPVLAKHHELPHVQARSSDDESANQKYIMPFKNENRRPNRAPAFAESSNEFQNIFNISTLPYAMFMKKNVERVRSLLDFVDKRLLSSLFEERSAHVEFQSLTPLALWLKHGCSWSQLVDRSTDPYSLLTEYSTRKELHMMDGSGQYRFTKLSVNVSTASQS